ncbi:MAG: VOC family protein [Bdellovibrionota bacterium]
MKLHQITQILLFVTDVERSADWYSKFLKQTPEPDYLVPGQFAYFKLGSIEFCLHRADEKSPASTGGSVAYWRTDDLAQAITRAESLGATVYRGPLQIPGSSRWMAQIRDPFGQVIGLEGSRG